MSWGGSRELCQEAERDRAEQGMRGVTHGQGRQTISSEGGTGMLFRGPGLLELAGQESPHQGRLFPSRSRNTAVVACERPASTLRMPCKLHSTVRGACG